MSPANSRQFKNKAGFTLIELLIVIAVIGILSGMVMVSFDGAKDKARIAKSLQFSNSVQNAIGVDMVGRWNFEKIEEGKVIDTSGYGNDGVVHGATLVPGMEQLGNALSFDGVDDYVDCGNDSSLDVSKAVTVEAWVKVNAFGTNQYRGIAGRRSGDIVDGCNIQYGLSSTWMTGNRLEFWAHKEGFTDCNGSSYIASSVIDLNKWYHVVGTYDSMTGLQALYLNGVKNAEANKGAGVKIRSFASQPFEIGRNPGGSNWRFNGTIDDVRIYSSALSFSAIREQYLAGLDKLLARGQITEDDYQQRIAELNSNYVARK